MHDALNVIFAGGGTGGHVYPALAMRDALRARTPTLEVCFVGARGGMEASLLADDEATVHLLPGRGLRGAGFAGRIVAPVLLIVAVARGVRIIRSVRPDVVIGTGGYASAAMVLAAILTGTPRVLQEQNSVPGLVNRRLARFANSILLSFESSRTWIPGGVPVVVTGNPLRAMARVQRDAAARELGLDPTRSVVLIMGGSRGARSLNRASVDVARRVHSTGAQTLILCGESDHDALTGALRDTSGAVVLRYLRNMALAYSVSDVAVARAGASTVFELAAFGIPTVFVPYPHAADDHQRLNAEALASSEACVIVNDTELNTGALVGVVADLLVDAARRRTMSAAMTRWSRPGADGRAAEAIVDVVKKKPEPDPATGPMAEMV